VVMVGDRGLLTSARIEQTLRPAGLDWITALRAPAIKQLAAEGGPLQPSLFDHRDMAETPQRPLPRDRASPQRRPDHDVISSWLSSHLCQCLAELWWHDEVLASLRR